MADKVLQLPDSNLNFEKHLAILTLRYRVTRFYRYIITCNVLFSEGVVVVVPLPVLLFDVATLGTVETTIPLLCVPDTHVVLEECMFIPVLEAAEELDLVVAFIVTVDVVDGVVADGEVVEASCDESVVRIPLDTGPVNVVALVDTTDLLSETIAVDVSP